MCLCFIGTLVDEMGRLMEKHQQEKATTNEEKPKPTPRSKNDPHLKVHVFFIKTVFFLKTAKLKIIKKKLR